MALTYSPLFSGSSGNCAYIDTGDVRALIDAGLSGVTIEKALCEIGACASSIDAILVTHEHTDHIKGVGVLSRKYDIPVYANSRTWECMHRKIGDVAKKNICVFNTNSDFYLGKLNVHAFSSEHDAADPVGFSFSHMGRKVSVLTDTGRFKKSHIDVIRGSDLVMIESNFDENMLKNGPYPQALKKRISGNKGHLSNIDAANAMQELFECGVQRFILGHLSQENNTERKAIDTVCSLLHNCGIEQNEHVQIVVAHREKTTGVFVLE